LNGHLGANHNFAVNVPITFALLRVQANRDGNASFRLEKEAQDVSFVIVIQMPAIEIVDHSVVDQRNADCRACDHFRFQGSPRNSPNSRGGDRQNSLLIHDLDDKSGSTSKRIAHFRAGRGGQFSTPFGTDVRGLPAY
jgi:hypothetical protein